MSRLRVRERIKRAGRSEPMTGSSVELDQIPVFAPLLEAEELDAAREALETSSAPSTAAPAAARSRT